MKRKYLPLLLTGLWAAMLWSCGETKNETINEQQDKDTVAAIEVKEPSQVLINNYGTRLQKIVKTDEGILRGVNFGDPVDAVKAREGDKPLEDSTNHIGYRIDLGNYEDLDIRYHLNGQRQVWGFTLDIYLDEQASVDSLFNDFKGYFSDRFGPNNFDNQRNMVAWNLADSLKVVVKDVGIKQAPGLQVQMINLKGAKHGLSQQVQ
jgi:hypothetical protein